MPWYGGLAMGRIRFSLKLVVALIAGFGIGAGWGWINGQGNEASPPLFRISGFVDIHPALRAQLKPTDILFVIATQPGQSRPTAVLRVSPVSLPYMYTLGPRDRVMSQEPLLPGSRFMVSARIDRDGQAGAPQPGDLVGKSAQESVASPARDMNVLIDTIVQ